MLFNSFQFILIFLPVSISVYFIFGAFGWRTLSLAWLVIVSLAFYGWDQPSRLPLLVYSMIFNYVIGWALIKKNHTWLLILGVTINIFILGYFKYADFILGSILPVVGISYVNKNIPLPVGISFFTFTQIAFLVDAWRNQVKDYHPLRYGLFVTYFPHLVAGPILHHKDMMPQFAATKYPLVKLNNVSLGLTWFGIGLFKKTFLADGIAAYVGPTFNAAAQGTMPGFSDAWIAALSYTLQIYFDFSGYSDMACGIALIMGVTIPLNFNSPYKARSLIDFWRRWHISLSRFLRDYLYIPLGGNHKGAARRYINILITMIIGGLWHGASWSFVMWGFIHGIGILVNHAWRSITRLSNIKMPSAIGWAITFLVVVIAWIPFRANEFFAAILIWKGMIGLGGSSQGFLLEPIIYIIIMSSIVLILPNTQQILFPSGDRNQLLAWFPSKAWAIIYGMVFGLGIAAMTFYPNSEFLYFRF